MKLTVETIEPRFLRAEVQDTDHVLMNTLRRTLLNEVPCLAIDEVVVYENTGPLFDEVVSHRMGLLPVPLDREDYGLFSIPEEGEEPDPTSLVEFHLQVTAEHEPRWVLSQDLKPLDNKFAIADAEVPIAYLDQKQSIMLTATAMMGTAAQHAKWCPVAGVAYRERPHVEVTGKVELSSEHRKIVQELAPKDAFDLKAGKLTVHDEVATHDFIRNTEDMVEWSGVELTEDDDVFLFEFETTGQLTADLAFEKALEIVHDRLVAFRDVVPKLEPGETIEAV